MLVTHYLFLVYNPELNIRTIILQKYSISLFTVQSFCVFFRNVGITSEIQVRLDNDAQIGLFQSINLI